LEVNASQNVPRDPRQKVLPSGKI